MRFIEINVQDIGGNTSVRGTDTDLQQLVDSIMAVGLLYPVVLDQQHRIIDGRRRLAAFKKMGFTIVPARILECNDDATSILAEQDANVCRLELTPLERKEVADRYREALKPLAENRQNYTQFGVDDGVCKLHTPQNDEKLDIIGRVDEIAAKAAGIGYRTLHAIDEVVETADEFPEEMKPVVDEMQATGKVNPALKKAREIKKTLKRDPLKDANGNDVPDIVRDVFGDQWINKSLNELDEMLATLKSIKDRVVKKASDFPWMNAAEACRGIDEMLATMKITKTAIEFGIPHAYCPKCKGTGKVDGKKCDYCRGSGYLNVHREKDLKDQGKL